MPSDVQVCVNRANQITADLDAKVMDLAANWHPYQILTPQEVQSAVTAAVETLARAEEACNEADNYGLTDDLQSDLREFLGHVKRYQAQAQNYLNAAQAAKDLDQNVDAPEFKNWTLFAMQAASDGIVAASTVSCVQPWWAKAFGAFIDVFLALYDIAKGIFGVAKEVGKAAFKAVEDSLGFISWATKNFRWLMLGGLVLGGAGYLVYNKRRYGYALPFLSPAGSMDEGVDEALVPTRDMAPTRSVATRDMAPTRAVPTRKDTSTRRGTSTRKDTSTIRTSQMTTAMQGRGRR